MSKFVGSHVMCAWVEEESTRRESIFCTRTTCDGNRLIIHARAQVKEMSTEVIVARGLPKGFTGINDRPKRANDDADDAKAKKRKIDRALGYHEFSEGEEEDPETDIDSEGARTPVSETDFEEAQRWDEENDPESDSEGQVTVVQSDDEGHDRDPVVDNSPLLLPQGKKKVEKARPGKLSPRQVEYDLDNFSGLLALTGQDPTAVESKIKQLQAARKKQQEYIERLDKLIELLKEEFKKLENDPRFKHRKQIESRRALIAKLMKEVKQLEQQQIEPFSDEGHPPSSQ